MLEDRVTRLEEDVAELEERISRVTKLAHAIHLSLDQETQKRVADRFVKLMQSQQVSDSQLAKWKKLEKEGVKTPLSEAEANLKQMKAKKFPVDI